MTTGSQNRALDTLPNALDLWQGIGGHFDSLTQILAEFVDNSISNFASHKNTSQNIRIDFERSKGGYTVTVEDTGTGIPDLEPVMRLGDKTAAETYLNEHGFGLKHALASANYDNDAWSIYTRTKDDITNKVYRRVASPYKYDLVEEKVDVTTESWPGHFNDTGTIIKFTISDSLLESVQRGVRGKVEKLTTSLDYLVEDLGYIYAGVITKGKATIQVVAENEAYNKSVSAVEPQWVGFYRPNRGSEQLDLGAGTITVEYIFGEIEDSQYRKYYKKNQATQGAEIRINGRLILSNLFTEIWGLERHNAFNHFLVQINLVTDDAKRLPQTRTSKNGVRSGDQRLEKLLEWIHKVHPTPDQRASNAQSERELVDMLAKNLEIYIRSETKQIIPEHEVFRTLGSPVPADLYVFDGKDAVIYEAKKDWASIKEVYQLVMYWDGLVRDGVEPAEGVLIAAQFPPAVKVIMEYFNGRQDANGKPYKMIAKTWRDLGVKYPV